MSRALVPPPMQQATGTLIASPGVMSHGHVFVTGMTGSALDGSMPASIDAQGRNAFEKIGLVLAEAGLTSADIVEITSFHVNLRDHFDAFNAFLGTWLDDPFPAWTAVEVAGLRRAGALFEIRVVAALRNG